MTIFVVPQGWSDLEVGSRHAAYCLAFVVRLVRRRGGGAAVLPVPSLTDEKGPILVEMSSSSGGGLFGRSSSAVRIFLKCSGMVPQQPPIIVAPQLRAITA